jgi:ferrous iron transport protein B
MSEQKNPLIALVGNPNCGKTSLFNQLTGLRQHVANFPGVTVDKFFGDVKLEDELKVTVVDFPGLYSLYPNSSDEKLVVQIFSDPKNENYPDAVIYVADITNLERHLLLATQISDLGIPMILALNMTDLAEEQGLHFKPEILEQKLGIPVISISGRTGKNVDSLKEKLASLLKNNETSTRQSFYSLSSNEKSIIAEINLNSGTNSYQALLNAHHFDWLPNLDQDKKHKTSEFIAKTKFNRIREQINETMARYNKIGPILKKAELIQGKTSSLTDKLDGIITNRYIGPLIFFGIMLLVFQAIYSWSTLPMDWIESGFLVAGEFLKNTMPQGWFTDLLTDGILAGLGGIMVFIPQIAILFLLISALEEVGYMSRAVYMFDWLMQRFGLNGRSLVALISGGACAIPAIMSTRTISNWKERLTTIMVTPLISCSARIPVYTILIGFVVKPTTVFGVFNAQGLAFMGLYLLGIFAALGSALVFKKVLKSEDHSFLMMELPIYKPPIWKNVLFNVKEKVGTFIVEAGKVIMVISIILWFSASYGPGTKMQEAEQLAKTEAIENQLSEIETDDLVAARKIEASFAGHMGKFIEPAIKPLGYDWKIGIALITSFAAREVFVGTMAAIYSIGSSDNEVTIRDRMKNEVNLSTGKPTYTLATSLSLLIFYVFAMQCMSTLAVVKKETKSWKWPFIQFVFMSVMAYVGAFVVYQIFS